MTYLVTGGTGFIGAYVVRDLLDRGERVVCFDIAPSLGLVTVEELVNVAMSTPSVRKFLIRPTESLGVTARYMCTSSTVAPRAVRPVPWGSRRRR